MSKWVYNFGFGKADGNAAMRNILGGKGANLAEMNKLDISVPPGFTISTKVCDYYYSHEKNYPNDLISQVDEAIKNIETKLNFKFGGGDNPLLVSVRSGSRASMPGMMDTVLNLGLNDATVIDLAKASNDKRFALDSYRRFIQMYSDIVLGIPHTDFEEILEEEKLSNNVILDTDLSEENLEQLVDRYKKHIYEVTKKEFPQDPNHQLWGAISAVFDSWKNQRAITYRKLNDIPEEWGTAVNIQAMVFGNMGDDCCTGVAFTRNPSTGEKEIYGEYLVNAQGEDVVAGIRTPQPLSKKKEGNSKGDSLEEKMPKKYNELITVFNKLEEHYLDMQDVEFTIQQNKLWILQTRNGKRTTSAAIKIAVDLVEEKVISKKEAIIRINPETLEQLLHPTLDPDSVKEILTKGLPASPGAASGKVVFTADDAEKLAASGVDVILVRSETSPEDIHGMHAAKGILTGRGGMTSHAAVVARGMGRPCVSGASEININETEKKLIIKDTIIKNEEIITINGSSGEVILGKISTVEPELSSYFNIIMQWSDELRKLSIRTNAETPEDVNIAKKFGAEGIGLCRTEHMFFDNNRILFMRQMILAQDLEERKQALKKLEPFQREDFKSIFKIMEFRPVTIRLLDPPLHEFLPKTSEENTELLKKLNISKSDLNSRIEQLGELNPMLGHRGSRLGITFPEIYRMQAKAIIEAAVEVENEIGKSPSIEIMIPLIFSAQELKLIKNSIKEEMNSIEKIKGKLPKLLIGTMIELPRAALLSGEIAKHADFFSFGTNDLTQTTYGISRDDSARFLDAYIEKNIIEVDPFISLDTSGVGQLIKIAKDEAKKVNESIKLGICGEHGGDPKSINFCNKLKLDYVSCSPYRIPIARLAAAQSVIFEDS
ncbi:MAG: pyruvate, phosphate dikinase [Rickettsiales bacterium]|nr:pyruvate, phosphate dikinase [Rickettsiales bacterium]OUV82491.1 MAG: pyruvate, phosphate dikinase [Rickettsiales bacterium TMED131]